MRKSFDEITVQKIKDAANIVDVIGDFIQLRKRGIEYQGLCPFHDDRSLGSFSVSPKKGIYKCFSCGAHGDAVEFLMQHEKLNYPDAIRYLAKKYNIWLDEETEKDERFRNIKPSTPKAIVEKHLDMLVMPRSIVASVAKSTQPNIFVEWFRSLPWSTSSVNDQRARVNQTLWLYCVGGWTDGRVVFFQIDEKGQPRGGKLMRYNTNGKRDKTSNPGWLHNQAGIRDVCDMDHHEYRSTLFGMHLLNRYPEATVNIVESEKTAMICANAYGQPDKNIWMACGGIKFLKLESLQPLIDSGRQVWLWPDKDGIGEWQTVIDKLGCDRIHITKKFLESNWIESDGPKADVADIIVRHMTQPETIEQRQPVPDEPEVRWASNEPFVDADELNDPRVRKWRTIMGRLHSSGWGKWPKSLIAEVKTAADIIIENPILEPLIQ